MDAAASPGYDEVVLKRHRLPSAVETFLKCAQRCRSTFPAKFVDHPQTLEEFAEQLEINNAAPAGNASGSANGSQAHGETGAAARALELGRWANGKRGKAPQDSGSTGQLPPGFPSPPEVDAEVGGVSGAALLVACGEPRERVVRRVPLLELLHALKDSASRVPATGAAPPAEPASLSASSPASSSPVASPGSMPPSMPPLAPSRAATAAK